MPRLRDFPGRLWQGQTMLPRCAESWQWRLEEPRQRDCSRLFLSAYHIACEIRRRRNLVWELFRGLWQVVFFFRSVGFINGQPILQQGSTTVYKTVGQPSANHVGGLPGL